MSYRGLSLVVVHGVILKFFIVGKDHESSGFALAQDYFSAGFDFLAILLEITL